MADQRGNVKKTVASPAATLKRNKNGKPIFEGQLAEPITYPPRPLADLRILPDGVETAEEDEAKWRGLTINLVIRQKYTKLFALLSCYGLKTNPPDWLGLALRLGDDFVPGFKVKEPNARERGRPRNQPDVLLEDVDDYRRRNPRLGIAAACNFLVKQKGPWHGNKPSTLETRYHKEKRERSSWLNLIEASDKRGLIRSHLASLPPQLPSSGDPEPSNNRRKSVAKSTATRNRR